MESNQGKTEEPLFGGDLGVFASESAPVFPKEPSINLSSGERTIDTTVIPTQQTSEVKVEDYQDAKRQRDMDDVSYALEELAKEDERFMKKYRDRTLDEELTNIDRDVANALREVTGVRKPLYEFTRFFGVNMYMGDVLKHRRKLDKRAISLERALAGFKEKLYNENDKNPDIDISERGLSERVEAYKRICKGTAQSIQHIDRMLRGLERQKSETDVKVEECLEYTQKEPDNEEYTSKLQYYQSRLKDIQSHTTKLQRDKKRLGSKLKNYHGVVSTLELQYANYDLNITQAEEALGKLQSTLELIDQYLEGSKGFRSLATFQKEMTELEQSIGATDKAIGIYHDRTTRALERNYHRLQRHSENGDPTKHLRGVKSVQSRLLAVEDKKVNELVELYSR